MPDRPSSNEDSLWSDPSYSISQGRDVWEELDIIPTTIPNKVPILQKPSILGNDDNWTSMFTTVHWTRTSHETTPLVPSSDTKKQVGDDGEGETSAHDRGHLKEEPLDYGPSLLRKKDDEKSPH